MIASLRPVAAKPEAAPTAAAVTGSEAGKSGIPAKYATIPAAIPNIPQMIGIHLLFSGVALTMRPTRYESTVIASTVAIPKSIYIIRLLV